MKTRSTGHSRTQDTQPLLGTNTHRNNNNNNNNNNTHTRMHTREHALITEAAMAL